MVVSPSSSQRFDGLAASFASSEVHRSSPTIDRLHVLVESLAPSSVCDVACGAGHTGLSFATTASRIVGVDPAPSMLEELRTLANGVDAAVESVEAFAEDLPLGDGEFDLVVSRLAPHHFSDIGRAMAEFARVTRPGGRVAVIDLEGDEDLEADNLNHQIEVLHDPTHVRSYSAAEWRQMFEKAGLKVVDVEPDHRESPNGVSVDRWCEIAGSGDEAKAKIREVLSAAHPSARERLGIEERDKEFFIPVRTVLIVGERLAE